MLEVKEQAVSGQPESIIAPRANTDYPIVVQWNDTEISFTVRFSDQLAAWLRSTERRIDLNTGEAVSPNGRDNLLIPLGAYPESCPQPIPAWLMHNGMGAFGFPQGQLSLDLQGNCIHYRITGDIQRLEPQVEAGRYEVATHWLGQDFEFQLELTPAYAAWINEHHMHLDLESGELVQGMEYKRYPLLPGKPCTQLAEANPWVVWEEEYRCPGIPGSGLVLDRTDDGRTDITYDGFTRPNCFQQENGCDFSCPDREPLTAAEWPAVRSEVAQGIFIEAENEELIAKARALISEVLGSELSRRDSRLPDLEREHKQLLDCFADLLYLRAVDPAERHREVLSQARALVPAAAPDWTRQQLTDAVDERLTQLYRTVNHPVEVYVVPAGKHWSAMPTLSPIDASGNRDSSLIAANVRYTHHTKVFLPEDALTGEYAWLSKHELYHVLMHNLMSPELHEEISSLHSAAQREVGPLARPYGSTNPDEFWATFSELFEGRCGAEGREWFREQQPRLYEIMSAATGKTFE